MSTPPGGFDPTHQPPGAPQGYYPQQAYYAPGWQAPVGQVPPPRPRRRGLVVSLVVVAGLVGVSILGGVATAVRFAMDTRPLGAVDSPLTAAARRLDVGHCIEDLPEDGEVARVRVVPCDDPHEAEVVGSLSLEQDGWPGHAAVARAAVAYCEMDRTQVAAGFRAVVWEPTEAGWGQGDTRVVCLAWTGDGRATGSFTAGDTVTRA